MRSGSMMRLLRWQKFGLFLLLGVFLVYLSYNTQVMEVIRSTRKPNIIFILADDLGWNDIGYHGSDLQTPVLDSLAASGVKLENYYVQPVCSPTRGQLMIGRYQIHTGLQSNNLPASCACGLPLESPTIADKLKENGYSTHIVGKWHLGFYTEDHMPTRRGFDSYLGYLVAQQGYFDHVFWKGCTKDEGKPKRCFVDFHRDMDPVTDMDGQYSTHIFRDRAIEIIQDHSRDTPEKPLFMYLPFQAVHGPREAPQTYIDRLKHIPGEERRIFAAMALAMDEAVGRIVDALKQTDMWKDTLIVFSSDNGGQMRTHGNNWPLRGGKGTLWEGGIRVVGFASGPFLDRGGITSHDLIHVTDWFPTLVGLAGGDTSGMDLDGHDVWETLSKGKSSPRREILHNINHLEPKQGGRLTDSPFDNRMQAAVRVDNWKLITGNPGLSEWIPPHHMQHLNSTHRLLPDHHERNIRLYDVIQDPTEEHEISDEHPHVVQRLLDRLAYYDSTAVEPIPQSRWVEASPEYRGDTVWGPWFKDGKPCRKMRCRD